MKRITLSFCMLCAAVIIVPVGAQEAPINEPASAIITELQTASADSAGDEFVEIVNVQSSRLNIDGWAVQYKSATGADWQTKARLSGSIEGRARFLIGTTAYQNRSIAMNSGLAGASGHVRIIDETDTVHDSVGWGLADSAEFAAAVAPSGGEVLKRSVNEDGFFVDTDNNLNDFFLSTNPTPQGDQVVVAEVEQPLDAKEETNKKDQPKKQSQPESPASPGASSTAKIEITELFIDPDKPLTDDEDEFVEIYNPNAFSVDLAGYVIETGDTYSYSFTLPKIEIKPTSYIALYAIDTNLTLSNTSGRARISTSTGAVVHETEPYEKAKPNTSWGVSGLGWAWFDAPSPGKQNPAGAGLVGEDGLSDRSDSVVAASADAAGDDATPESQSERTVYEDPEEDEPKELNNRVLAGVGSMAILYAGYEYRHDAGNRFHQLKEYVRHRLPHRKKG